MVQYRTRRTKSGRRVVYPIKKNVKSSSPQKDLLLLIGLQKQAKRSRLYNPDKDMEILKAIYNGNHVSYDDLDRALKLLKLMEIELKRRVQSRD